MVQVNKKYLLVMIIIVMASAIRLYNPVFRSIWGDESHSIYSAMEFSKHNIITSSFNVAGDAHLPAYFFLLSVWMGIFGIGEYALRMLSIIIGIAAVIAFYYQSKEMFDENVARISTLLLAVSPIAVMHSQEIRMYGLLLLMTVLSSLFYWRLLSGKIKTANIAGYSVFTALLLLTHIYSVLVLFAQGMFAVFILFKEREYKRTLTVIGGELIALIIVSPLYIKIIFQQLSTITSGTAEMAFSVFPTFTKPFLYFFTLSLGETMAPWNYLVTVPAAIAFGYLFVRSFFGASDKRVAYLLTLCAVPVLVAAVFLRPTMPKYLVICLPFYLMALSYSLSMIKNDRLRYVLLAVMVLTQMISVGNYFTFKEYHNSNQIEPWRKVSAIIEKNYREGDIIVSTNYGISERIMNYYLNIKDKKNYKLFDLEQGTPGSIKVHDIKGKRVWFISHILDDRIFPPNYIADVRSRIEKNYSLVYDEKFVPYEDTLVSKLPIKRHEKGSSRIELILYKAKR